MAATLLKVVRRNAVIYIPALLLGVALLWLYRAADEAALRVLLWPYAKATELFYHMDLRYIAGVGYCAAGGVFAIGKACMGINFAVMMFFMLIFAFTHRFEGYRKIIWLPLSLLISTVVGVVISCIRIVGSVPFVTIDKFATLHTALGAALYLAALAGAYLTTKKILGGSHNEKMD